MLKPLALSIAACLTLTSCQVFEKSAAWKEATSVRPGAALREPDPSHAYATQLHTALAEKGIEHKVITYQYRYTTRLREEAVGTRTAVVYRDNSTGKYPWWLKDERLNTPFWLPNGDPNQQVSFYIRRKAEVIETEQYPGQDTAKSTLAFARPTPALRSVKAKSEPQVAAARPAPAHHAAAPVAVSKPAPASAVSQPAQPKKLAQLPDKRKSASAPKSVVAKVRTPSRKIQRPATFAATAKPTETRHAKKDQHHSSWHPPGVLDAKQQSALTAPRDSHLEAMFKRKHGTDFNRFSPLDRRKMQTLQQGLASRG